MAETVYFDGVFFDLLEEIAQETCSDESSLLTAIDSFFKKFGFTDIVLFQKADQIIDPKDAKKSDQRTHQKTDQRTDQKSDPKNESAAANSPSSIYQNLFKTPDLFIRYYKGVEISVDNENELYARIRKERPKADFLTVRSDDEKIIRAAADSLDVDAVVPISNSPQKPAAGKINHIAAKIAADKKTAFAFDIAPLLYTKGYRRSKLISDIMEMIPILRKYCVPILLFSGASGIFDIRGPYELEAVGRLFGMTQEETISAVSEFPRKIISERKKKISGKIIAPGVEIIEENSEE